MKVQLQNRGTGEKARVRVTLSSGIQVRGYISKIDEVSFELTDNKKGQTTTISYADVQKLQGPGLSKHAKIGIGVGVGVAVVVVIAAVIAVQAAAKLNKLP